MGRNHLGKCILLVIKKILVALRKKDFKKAYVKVDGEVDEGY